MLPFTDTIQKRGAWKTSLGAFLTGTFIAIKQVMVCVMGAYFRNGIHSPEGREVMEKVTQVTRAGEVPFILHADFNATPAEVEASIWPSILCATIRHTNAPTSTARNIDFLIHISTLDPLFRSVVASWSSPFATHASIRSLFSRAPEDLRKWVPAAPRKIPKQPKSIEWSSELW